MARPLRIERPGGWYHCTARGNEQRPIYRTHSDREHFCALLAEMVPRFQIGVHCYALMSNHYHLLLETPQPNLSQTMHWLNVSYSVWFNRRYQRHGHLFQGRFDAVVVCPEEWGLELSRYLHLNPVRIQRLGLDRAARHRRRMGIGEAPDHALVQERLVTLQSYPWSSYRAYIGAAPKPAWLECETVLALGGGRANQRRSSYQKYVEDAVREGLPESPWSRLRERVVLGSETFLENLRGHLSGNPREQPGLEQLRSRPTLSQVIQVVEQIKREPWHAFRDRHGDWGRDLVLYLGRKRCGLKLTELAEVAGGIDYVSVASAVRRFGQRAMHDRALSDLLRRSVIQLQKE